MNQIKNFAVLFTLAVLTVMACNSKKAAPDFKADIIRLNNLYDSALIKKDTGTLKNLYAESFRLTNPDGRLMSKQEQLLNVATSELNWEAAKSENVTVDVYNNMAVLIGEFRGNGSYRGTPISVHERYTTVWIKTDTSWQLVAEQANIIR